MHNEIKRFGLTGTITSDRFVVAREALIKDVEDSMRDEGFVPVLDLHPQFTREYDPETEAFSFEISVYGAYVGEEESWHIAGMMNGTAVERYTRPQK